MVKWKLHHWWWSLWSTNKTRRRRNLLKTCSLEIKQIYSLKKNDRLGDWTIINQVLDSIQSTIDWTNDTFLEISYWEKNEARSYRSIFDQRNAQDDTHSTFVTSLSVGLLCFSSTLCFILWKFRTCSRWRFFLLRLIIGLSVCDDCRWQSKHSSFNNNHLHLRVTRLSMIDDLTDLFDTPIDKSKQRRRSSFASRFFLLLLLHNYYH